MSRAFGDRLLKQFVVADPEIRVETVDERLEFLVIASDGLWDSVSNEEAMKVVASENKLDVAARNLAKKALCGGSGDNITCIVVKFHHNAATQDRQSNTPFPVVDSASDTTADSSAVDPLLRSNAASSSVANTDPVLHTTPPDSLSAGSLDSSVSDSTLSGNVDSLLNRSGADST